MNETEKQLLALKERKEKLSQEFDSLREKHLNGLRFTVKDINFALYLDNDKRKHKAAYSQFKAVGYKNKKRYAKCIPQDMFLEDEIVQLVTDYVKEKDMSDNKPTLIYQGISEDKTKKLYNCSVTGQLHYINKGDKKPEKCCCCKR